MNFITDLAAPKASLTVLSLHNSDNGTVELWGYTSDKDDGYRIGVFRDGAFIAQQMPSHAKTLLNLVLTDTGHIVIKLQ